MFEQAMFQDDEAAREQLEAIRWPEGPVCPHCGCTGNIKRTASKRRAGLYTCNDCRKQFTVTVGTVFERSHVPLHKWFQAAYLMCSSKKGISSHQIMRSIGVTYKTAWFMTHRIREAMAEGTFALMGGEGQTVEVDETFFGIEDGKQKAKAAWHHKNKIVSRMERNGSVRSFHVERVNAATLKPLLMAQIASETRIMTDQAVSVPRAGRSLCRAPQREPQHRRVQPGTSRRTPWRATSPS
jgi:transposase-like protein